MRSGTEGFAKLSDAIFPGTRSGTEKIVAEFMQSKTAGLAALTTDPGITTCRKHKCREGQGWPRAARERYINCKYFY